MNSIGNEGGIGNLNMQWLIAALLILLVANVTLPLYQMKVL
ncbi:MAG: hypothetical protein QGG67_06835 [Gammaproteobacteria bacterium]|nr:hypothetical protein [Gammaproteobacteria bacterium]